MGTEKKVCSRAGWWAAAFVALISSTARADDVVAEAEAQVKLLSGPQTTWNGPTSGPKPEPGKHIVWLSVDEQNQASHQWGEALTEAAKAIGWTVTVIDGRDTPIGWLEGMNQAIALKADGVVTDVDAGSIKDPVKQALDRGMVLVGIHATGTPGAHPELGLFFNIGEDPRDIGRAQADWVIADSKGKAHVVVTTHGEFAIAMTKATATKDRLVQCSTCVVEEFSNSPMGEVAQRQPQLVAAWVQKYRTPLYITAVADYTLQFQIPALQAGGVDPKTVKLVGADGDKAAYARIRAGDQYQVVTVSEPNELLAYQAVDELNRAFNHQAPSGFIQRPFLVTPANINTEGGDQNMFMPSNNYKQHYLEIWGAK
jgi:ribose transport system substrate-binding protein